MPTVFVWRGYRFFFYSNEGAEPAHVHVTSQGHECKFWLVDITVAKNSGFPPHDLTAIAKHIAVHRRRLQTAWSDHFGH
ncbi:DUF4160 domain-containing protein [Beijerinckia sp. L45]|uniref:DUF4160 domain-containing protein n=1 Tax=Beijerinckia sp. L45 TaxID=1641855 RepID=UPI00131E9A76|nr:DUF4160 domain-containing protein [Beijerinckia sp. L45]